MHYTLQNATILSSERETKKPCTISYPMNSSLNGILHLFNNNKNCSRHKCFPVRKHKSHTNDKGVMETKDEGQMWCYQSPATFMWSLQSYCLATLFAINEMGLLNNLVERSSSFYKMFLTFSFGLIFYC